MSVSQMVDEYVQSRLRQPAMVGWVLGSVVLLCAGTLSAPGRPLSKRDPDLKLRHIVRAPAGRKDTTTTSSPSLDAACPQARSTLQKCLYLFRLAVPSVWSAETLMVAAMAVLLLLRTATSVAMASLTGRIACAVTKGQSTRLFHSALLYMLTSIPATLFTQSIEYLAGTLKLRMRRNITRQVTRRYLAPQTFFRLAGLHVVEHVDQRVVRDVERFSQEASFLLHSVAGPFFQAATFTVVLASRAGWQAPALLWAYLTGFVGLAFWRVPNFDLMAIRRAEADGALAAAHHHVLTHAEEIATTRGHACALAELARLGRGIRDGAAVERYAEAEFSLLETAYTKYGTWTVSWLVCGLALHGDTPRAHGRLASLEDLTGRFAETAYVCEQLARAIGGFYWNIKHLILLSGYSRRLYQLIDAIDLAELDSYDTGTPSKRLTTAMGSSSAENCGETPLASLSISSDTPSKAEGRIERGDHVEFVDVPLTLPSGEVLCASLSFHVRPGMNLLIMGPNGCGKSSTFRLLGELWPLRGGRLVKPEQDQMYYVPQRPYMYDGTLFEQVIYPLKRKQVSAGEAELYGCLEMAGLGGILSRPKVSWDAQLSWSGDFLSMGEKQRLAMARLFFHRPRFAILDECSCSVDLDVEAELYTRCRELGITVITIAHRRSVWQYHSHMLHFDGNGGYMFGAVRFVDGGATLVLPRVLTASDSAVVGTEVVIHVKQTLPETLDSASA